MIGSYAYVSSYQSGAAAHCTIDSTTVASIQLVVTRNVFAFCGSSAVVYAAQTTSVGNSVFGGCLSVRFGGSAHVDGVYGNAKGSIGPVFINDSSLVISDCAFSNCVALSQSGVTQGPSVAFGASLYVAASSALYVSNQSSNNIAVVGRVQTSNVTLHVSNSSFSASASMSSADACPFANTASSFGGAIYVALPEAGTSIQHCRFTNCSVAVTCASAKSASLAAGGALAVSSIGLGVLEVSGSVFRECFSTGSFSTTFLQVVGGAIAAFDTGNVLVSACSFSEFSLPYGLLHANSSGGTAVYVQGSHIFNVSDSIFSSLLDSPDQNFGAIKLQPNNFINAVFALYNCSIVASSSSLVLSSDGDSQVLVVIDQSNLSITKNVGTLFQTGRNTTFSGSNSFFQCPAHSFARFSRAQFITADCLQCSSGSYAVTPNVLGISALSSADDLSRLVQSCNSSCPFGISDCNTSVTVAEGFWAAFSPVFINDTISLHLTVAPCAQGYCCLNILGCNLSPPTFNGSVKSLNDTFDCGNGLQGVLCGECRHGYTRSLAFKGCIPNEVCERNIWWCSVVLVISCIGIALMLLLGISSADTSTGCISIVLFFLQLCQYAVPRLQTQFESSVSQVAVLQSLLSFVNNSCFSKDVSVVSLLAYRFLAAPAIGTTGVFMFLTAKYVMPRICCSEKMSRLVYGVCVQSIVVSTLSYGYSSMLVYLTSLATCQAVTYTNSSLPSFVLSVDGNVECYQWWQILCFVGLVLLLALPLSFLALLHKRFEKHLSARARSVLCNAFKPRFMWWGSLLMAYRLALLAASHFILLPMFASLATGAIVLSMLITSIYMRPWTASSAQFFDIVCSVALLGKITLAFGSNAAAAVARVPSSTSPLFAVLEDMKTFSAVLTVIPVALLFGYYFLHAGSEIWHWMQQRRSGELRHVLLQSIKRH